MSDTPVVPLHPSYDWGFVVGRSISAMADTVADPDRLPEARGSNGRVTFTPLTRFKKALTAPTAFVQFEVVTARIENGNIVDAQGEEGIYLISGPYNVTFKIESGSIPSFDILVTPNHTLQNPLDLVTESPFVPELGTPVNTAILPLGAAEDQVIAWRNGRLVWVNGATQAEEAAARAETAATAAEEWTPSFVWQGTSLIINGGEPVDLKGEIEGMAVPFFDRALADAYQAAHPGAPVLWIDTSDPSQYYPATPPRDLVAGSYTIPSDRGATYRVNGASVSAGTQRITFPVGVEAVTVEIEAFPAAGYEFAFDAVASWTYTFEPVPVLYDGAASAAPVYLRLDDAVGTALPRNRGTGAYTTFNNTIPKLGYGKASVGTGATSAGGPGGESNFFLPYTRPLSGTVAVAYQFDAPMGPDMNGSNRSIRLGANWGDNTGWSVPSIYIVAANGAWMQVICSPGTGTGDVRNSNYPEVSEWADGTDITHVAYTWDIQAGTVKFFINGEVYWSSNYAPPADGPVGGNRAFNIISTLNGVRAGGLVWDFTRAWTNQEVSDLSAGVAR